MAIKSVSGVCTERGGVFASSGVLSTDGVYGDATKKPLFSSYTINGNPYTFNYPSELIQTAFSNASFQININQGDGAFPPITYINNSPDVCTVDDAGNVTIQSKGQISILVKDSRNNELEFKLAIDKFFFFNNSRVFLLDAESWAAANNGRLPDAWEYYPLSGAEIYVPPGDWGYIGGDFVRGVGSLVSEWGSMETFGWPSLEIGTNYYYYLSGSHKNSTTTRGAHLTHNIGYFDIDNNNANTFYVTAILN